MADPKLIEALSNASSLELFELSNIIDRLLADPRRIVATLNKLQSEKIALRKSHATPPTLTAA